MHGSTSPLKNGWPACSQRQCSRTCATARRTLSERGSTPKSCRLTRLYAVAVQGWPLGSSLLPDVALRAGNSAPPSHWPSSPCKASSRAPHPSMATRARSAATTSVGASTRSRNACHRMEGSESSSQSSTAMGLSLATLGRARPSSGQSRLHVLNRAFRFVQRPADTGHGRPVHVFDGADRLHLPL